MDVEIVCYGFGSVKSAELVQKYVEKMISGGVFLLKIKRVVLVGESDFCKICQKVIENLQKRGADVAMTRAVSKDEKHLYFVSYGEDASAFEKKKFQKLLSTAWCHREDLSLVKREYFL